MKDGRSYLLPAMAVAIFLVGWHVAVHLTGTTVFPAPIEVWRGLEELVRKGILWGCIRDSLFRVGIGYVLAVLCGIPIGIILGRYNALARSANPVIQMLRPISPLAWLPLAVVWFGVSELAPIFLIFLAAFFPVVVSTMNGVHSLPSVYWQVGRNFGLTPAALIGRVIFPAILPHVLTGLRIALGIAWLVVVAAEMIAVDSGLGYLITDSRNAGKRYDLVVAGMLMIGVIGLVLDVLIRRVERLKFIRWGFHQR